jgi:hypothetical protein
MVKAEKGGLLHSSGHAVGRGRLSTQLILRHLRGIGLSKQKNWGGRGQGIKLFFKQSQSQVWLWLAEQSWSGRQSGPVLGGYHLEGVIWSLFERITLAWVINCPHWECGSSRWFWFLVIKTLSVLSFLKSKVTVKLSWREWLRAKTDTKWRQGCYAFPVFS